jgi:hypothetical protein
MLDRLKKDNEKNFNSDIKQFDDFDFPKDKAVDQYTDISDPKKLSQDIEKEVLKQNKGEALKNVGNSANDNNKEITKRNLTKTEEESVAKDRGLGMHDIEYDNEPDERFEERMKKDMGEEIYKLRNEKIKYRKNMSMYEKDNQPVTVEPVTVESITGRYVDVLGTKRIVSFMLDEAVEVKNVDGLSKINTDGFGNTYSSKIEENVAMRNLMDSFEYYYNKETSKVNKISKGKQSLSEGKDKKEAINEDFERTMKLMNYNPSLYVNTHGVKKNRGF